MKKIKILYLVFGLLTASNTSTMTVLSLNDQKPQWRQFFQQYFTSIGIGALVGISTDIVADYFFEKLVPGVRNKTAVQELIVLLIKSYIKSKLLFEMRKDMRRYNLPCKDSLMYWVAHLSPFRVLVRDICLYAKKNYYC